MALIDTGPLVALIDPQDARHRAAARALWVEPGRVVTTRAVITEALYLIGRGRDPGTASSRLSSASDWAASSWTTSRWTSACESLALMKTYADVPMSLADASLVSLTEQRRKLRIVTFVSDSAGTERAMGSRRCYSTALAERAAAILHPPSGRACGKRSSTERI